MNNDRHYQYFNSKRNRYSNFINKYEEQNITDERDVFKDINIKEKAIGTRQSLNIKKIPGKNMNIKNDLKLEKNKISNFNKTLNLNNRDILKKNNTVNLTIILPPSKISKNTDSIFILNPLKSPNFSSP